MLRVLHVFLKYHHHSQYQQLQDVYDHALLQMQNYNHNNHIYLLHELELHFLLRLRLVQSNVHLICYMVLNHIKRYLHVHVYDREEVVVLHDNNSHYFAHG